MILVHKENRPFCVCLADTCGRDLDAGGFAIVVEGGGKSAISIELGVGIPVESATVVLHVSIEGTMAIVRMIEVIWLVHAVEDDAAACEMTKLTASLSAAV